MSLLFLQIKGPGIGLLGISLGADICLSMASFLKNVSATVSINGSGFNGNKTMYYKENCIPPLGHDLRRVKVAFSGLVDIVDIRNDIVGGCENPCMIPIEKAQGPILFIVGQDDHNWRSEFCAQIASERLQAHGKEKPQIISYPGTGHYIEPPYFPMCPASLHKLLDKPVMWGGEPRVKPSTLGLFQYWMYMSLKTCFPCLASWLLMHSFWLSHLCFSDFGVCWYHQGIYGADHTAEPPSQDM